MTRVIIPASEFSKVERAVVNGILKPILKDIRKDTKTTISSIAKGYKGTSSNSISRKSSIKGTGVVGSIGSKDLSLVIKPSSGTYRKFLINKKGYSGYRYKKVINNPELTNWVNRKYTKKDKDDILKGNKSLRIRPRSASGFPPLGSKYRDFFGRAFNKLLGDRSKYGLK